jgi:hypothetical protein
MNPPPKFIESERTSLKGRREGEDNGIRGGHADAVSERGRLIARADKVGVVGVGGCRRPPSYVPYKCTYVPYDSTFGPSNQGQTL